MLVVSGLIVSWTMETLLEFVICVGFLYWAFPGFFSEGFSRVNKMVDIVTNRMFDTLNRFSPRENLDTSGTLSTLTTLRRFSKEQRLRRALSREAEVKAKDAQLFDIKENVPEVKLPKRRPFMGLSCENCNLASRESLVSKTTQTLALKNILDYQLPASQNGVLPRMFSHLHQVYQLQKFDYPQLAEVVWRDERLKLAIEQTAIHQFQDVDSNEDEVYQELLRKNQKRGKKLLYDMRSTLSDFLLRFTSWVLYKLLPCFLTSVVVHPGQVEMLKKVSKSKLPLIFLPLHRSHLDYILISFILLNNDVRSPLVAAGDNLRIPFFGSLLRGLGAFFIKRRIDPVMGRKDHVYKTLLHTYMNECLRAGHNMEFFLEGGRTRTGKPCMPKYGILSVIVDTFMDGTIEDAILVPVSVNYEKLVDGNFVREQLGQPKEMETFSNAIQGIWKVLNSNYGMMRIDFNQPFSLRELVKTFNLNGKIPPPCGSNKKPLKSNPSTSSLYGTDVVSDEHKSLVESISKHIIYDCAKSTSIMSTNALAFLLLTKYREGVSLDELVEALNELRADLYSSQRDLGFSGDSIDVLNYAIEMFGPGLIHREKRPGQTDFIKPVTMLPNVIELWYYSNTLIAHYALESIVAAAICSCDFQSTVTPTMVVESALELCDILQYEFILCKPCQNLEQVVRCCLDDLATRHDLFVVSESEANCRRIQTNLDDEDDETFLQETPYILRRTEQVTKNLLHLRGLVMPLVEAYSLTAFTLEKLIGRQLLESELLKNILEEMQFNLDASPESLHKVNFAESISVDAIKNALKLYQKWDFLECHAEKKLRLYYLKEAHDNKESVNNLYEKTYKFRRSLIV